jgi:hypothetical protein
MSFFNGVGATRVTLGVAAVTMGANVPLNEWLIFELGFGMAGAAWATNLAQACGLLLACSVLLTGRFARDYRTRLTWRPRWSIVRRQVAVGLPIGVMYGADVLGVALLQLMIVQVSAADAAATQVVIMLTSLAYMPTIGVATAGTTLVGQAIGAGQRDWAARLGNVVIALCAALMLSIALLLLAGGRFVLPAFLGSGDAASSAAVGTGLLLAVAGGGLPAVRRALLRLEFLHARRRRHAGAGSHGARPVLAVLRSAGPHAGVLAGAGLGAGLAAARPRGDRRLARPDVLRDAARQQHVAALAQRALAADRDLARARSLRAGACLVRLRWPRRRGRGRAGSQRREAFQ